VLLPTRHIRADEKPNLNRPYCRIWADGRSTSLTLTGHEIGFPPSDENPVIVSSQIVTQHSAENANSRPNARKRLNISTPPNNFVDLKTR